MTPFVAHYEDLTQGQRTGLRVVTLEQANYPQGPGWRLVVSLLGGDTVYDEFRFLAKDFSSQIRFVSCGSLVHSVEVYKEDGIRGIKVDGGGQNPEELQLTMEGRRFPNGVVAFLLSRLSLQRGQTYLVPVFSSDMGPDRANLYQKIEVMGREKLKAKNGKTFDTWLIQKTMLDQQQQPLTIGGKPFPVVKSWITGAAPYTIRTDYGSHKQVWLTGFTPTPKASF